MRKSRHENKAQSQDAVRAFSGRKQIRAGLDKTSALVKLDGVVVGFVDLKPNSF